MWSATHSLPCIAKSPSCCRSYCVIMLQDRVNPGAVSTRLKLSFCVYRSEGSGCFKVQPMRPYIYKKVLRIYNLDYKKDSNDTQDRPRDVRVKNVSLRLTMPMLLRSQRPRQVPSSSFATLRHAELLIMHTTCQTLPVHIVRRACADCFSQQRRIQSDMLIRCHFMLCPSTIEVGA